MPNSKMRVSIAEPNAFWASLANGLGGFPKNFKGASEAIRSVPFSFT
jgi:hypothetical protein